MNLNSIFLRGQNSSLSTSATFSSHESSCGVYDVNYSSVRYPLDPRTGLPLTDSARLMSLDVSAIEKEQIMQRLQRLHGSYLPSKLSDDDIYKIVPPRYLTNDQLDIQRWRDYLGEHVLPFMSDSVKQTVSDEAGVSSDDTLNFETETQTETE